MTDTAPTSNGRILFADDDETFRLGLCELLRRSGFDCHCVSSAAEALERMQTERFEALISDIHMPGNRDLEFLGRVFELAPGLPVILLTGLPTVETAARSVRMPVTAYLIKPPNFDELRTILARAVNEYRETSMVRAQRERLKTWEHELADIQRRMRKSAGGVDNNASFIRLTLRNLILTLTDLEQAMAVMQNRESSTTTVRQAELISAIQRTVSVLEKTKQNFKSKELGALRQDLGELLEGQRPAVNEPVK